MKQLALIFVLLFVGIFGTISAQESAHESTQENKPFSFEDYENWDKETLTCNVEAGKLVQTMYFDPSLYRSSLILKLNDELIHQVDFVGEYVEKFPMPKYLIAHVMTIDGLVSFDLLSESGEGYENSELVFEQELKRRGLSEGILKECGM